jgi:F-type H+-transporting ATPase subunit c
LPVRFAGNVLLQCEPGCTVPGNHPLAAIYKEAVMKKLSMLLTTLAVATLVAPAAFAQEAGAAAGGSSNQYLYLSAAFGMALAAFGGAFGQGRIAAAACEGIARNPGAAGNIRTAMILGLVFVETLALFTLAIIFAKVK